MAAVVHAVALAEAAVAPAEDVGPVAPAEDVVPAADAMAAAAEPSAGKNMDHLTTSTMMENKFT